MVRVQHSGGATGKHCSMWPAFFLSHLPCYTILRKERMPMDKTTAWMLRWDGTAFPCRWHYYGSADPTDAEETIYAAEWLYDATQSEETGDSV